jgi:formate hydrogenlyase transcriptional activator
MTGRGRAKVNGTTVALKSEDLAVRATLIGLVEIYDPSQICEAICDRSKLGAVSGQTADSIYSLDSPQREALSLRAWEAIGTERQLKGVLNAVAEFLVPFVPFNGVGIIAFAKRADRRLFALHVVGGCNRQPQGEGHAASHPAAPAKASSPARMQIPYDASLHQRFRAGEPYTCPDLLSKERWYPHEFKLAAVGIRAYTSLPLFVRGELIGVATFGRNVAVSFSSDEVSTLQGIARALAVAVSNALAYEEIRTLRDQLAVENISLKEQLGKAPWSEGIIGNSEALRRAVEAAEQVASTDATVLITGETGTGKELLARAIHRRSPRAPGPMVKVNCAAVPHTLLASELFGHERGAFTGAVERRKGKFEQAQGGTLFLDEIGELSPEMQILLLRVLQEREFERVGGGHTVQVDVRVIAATNRNLAEDVRSRRFREDLFYRLNVFPIHMPALRERRADIPILVSHFTAKHGERHGRKIERVERRGMELLQSHSWPGNVRELENLVERAVILSRGGILRIECPSVLPTEDKAALGNTHQTGERQAIEDALRMTQGRVYGPKGAAALLGLPHSTLESRIRRLAIDKFRFKSSSQRQVAVQDDSSRPGTRALHPSG